MLTSDLFENKTPAAWRAGYERGLKYYRQGPNNPYPAGSEEAKDYADGYHNGELDSYDKYDTSTMNEGAVKELSQDLRSMSDAEFLARYKMTKAQARAEMKPGVAEGSLNEFAPGASGDDEAGDDPYKYPKPKRYNRSADYFEQFEADHFDREDFDDDTGVFKGYWGNKQIAYFKFDNPARTGGNNPGMGWYYEPESSGRSDDTAAAPDADNADEHKQQELSMIRAFLKSGNRPNPDSQIGRLMKKHGLAEAQNDYFKRRKDEEDRIAGVKAPAKRTPKQTDYEKKRKQQDVTESYPKHQDLSGISTDKLKAYLAKQSQQSVPGEGNQIKRVRAELQSREQGLAEVSKATLDRYVEKAVDAHGHADFAARQSKDDPALRSYHKSQAQTAEKRRQGISRALDRMSKTEGVAEGSREQVDPSTVWEVSFDYGPHQSDKVKVRASSQEEAEQKGMRAAKKLGHRFPQLNWAMPVEQGVAEEQLDEQELAEAVGTLELADFLFKGLEQKFPKVVERYGHEVVGDAIMDVAEENQDVNSVSDVDILIDDIIEKLQNYNDNGSGLAEATVSRLYYNVVGTSGPELRKDFGMRHDRRGWFLSESSGRGRIMDAQRAFGSPKLVEYDLAASNGAAATLGPDNVISPIGTVPRGQQINKKVKNKRV